MSGAPDADEMGAVEALAASYPSVAAELKEIAASVARPPRP